MGGRGLEKVRTAYNAISRGRSAQRREGRSWERDVSTLYFYLRLVYEL